mmetsp:Transcript_2045/g.4496  ORF Transcript_2045/g.4496 Transcript_2045/m.4496 type:complete len:313 (-) Transcript_2045:127-1065(-)
MSGDGCKIGWYPTILFFYVAVGLALSLYSSLDCSFLVVDLGFVPRHYTSDEVSVGLWSFEGSDGHCVSHPDSYTSSFSLGDSLYTKWFMKSDTSWTTSRIFAIASVLLGFIAMMCALKNICSKEPCLVDILTYTTIIAVLCEGSKFGLFFGISLCTSKEYWYDDESDTYSGSEACDLSFGSFIGIGSIAAYFLSAIMTSWYTMRPANIGDDEDYYDERSLQSWMHSEAPQSGSKTHLTNTAETEDSGLYYEDTRPTYQMSTVHTKPFYDETDLFEEEEEFNTYGGPGLMPNRQAAFRTRVKDEMSQVTWDPF